MKKITIILVTLLLLTFTGCSAKKITSDDIENALSESLSTKVQKANNYFEGYKYYVPRGFNLENRKNYNHILLSNGEYYFLYIDAVSYYHKKQIKVNFDNDKLYFSKKISYNGNEGYIKIDNKKDNLYLLEIAYNYSKIEASVKEENLLYAIKNSLKILSSVEYNDIILDTLVGEKSLDYKEETYDFFESKRENGNFLDYIEEYGVYDKEDKIKDEDVLDTTDY